MKNKLIIRNCDAADFSDMTAKNCDIRIADGIITEIGVDIIGSPEEDVLDAKGMLCIPAFCDTHTHLVQSLQKGRLDDLCITDWLIKMLSVQSKLTEEEWYWGVLIGLLQGMRFGVTTFNEMTYFPYIDAVAQAYKDSNLRVTFGLGATDIAENESTAVLSIDDALKQAETIYGKYHNTNNGLIRTSVAPQGLPACTKELMQSLKAFAKGHGLVFHTHLAEGKKETEWVKRQTGYGEGEALYNYGILDDKTVLAHSIWLEDYELDLIAKSGATVAHCPSTNMKISDGIPPIYKMLERNVKVAIGCDGEASSSNRDMIREARCGAYLQKAVSGQADVMPADVCYKMMTVNGARALGYENLGEIKAGNRADILLLDMQDISLMDKDTRLSNLIYAGTGFQVDTVLCDGKIVLDNKCFTGFDIEEVMAKGEEIIQGIYNKYAGVSIL